MTVQRILAGFINAVKCAACVRIAGNFSFVPFPRDTMADAYYQAFDIFGFVVPRAQKISKAQLT